MALRKQYAGESSFKLKNIGAEPFFFEFEVTNPATKRTYRVAIRGEGLGVNYCSCPDYAVNTLGTCKHIEFTLAKLRKKRGAKAAFAEGFPPAYSEVYLRYGAKRDVIFQPGRDCPASLRTSARRFFEDHGVLKSDAYHRFGQFLTKVNTNGHEVRCYDDALEFISQSHDRTELCTRIDQAFPPKTKTHPLILLRRQKKGKLLFFVAITHSPHYLHKNSCCLILCSAHDRRHEPETIWECGFQLCRDR